MSVAKTIKGKFEDYSTRADDLRIEGWSFEFRRGQRVNVKLDKGEIGGPYGPLSSNEIFKGSAYIRWADGRVSKAKLDAPALEDLDASLQKWRATSYVDEDAPQILEPQALPEMNLMNPGVVDIVTRDPAPLFEYLKLYDRELGKSELVEILEGKSAVAHSHTDVMNSKGLAAGWDGAYLFTNIEVNEKFWSSFSERTLPTEEDFRQMMQDVETYLRHSNNPVAVKSGNMPIVFVPETFKDFLNAFVMGGMLGGEAVAHGKALYTVDDFKSQRRVFHERVNLFVDSLDELATDTAPCSGEGVPAREHYLVQGGRLISPHLDLKYAGKTGMEPTSPGGLKLVVDELMPYADMVRGMDRGLIVYDVQGMHTQSSKEGQYNIPVAEGLVVEQGKVVGSILGNVLLSGNLFEDLKNENTQFAEYSTRRGKPQIAMLTETSVTGAQ